MTELLNFLNSSKTELFTLLGVFFGAIIAYVGSQQSVKSSERAFLRSKRLAIAQEACSLLNTSQYEIYKVRDLLKYHPDNRKVSTKEEQDFHRELNEKLIFAQKPCSQFSDFFHSNRILLPKRIDMKFRELIRLDISLTLGNDHLAVSNPTLWIEEYDRRSAVSNELIEVLRIFTGGDKK